MILAFMMCATLAIAAGFPQAPQRPQLPQPPPALRDSKSYLNPFVPTLTYSLPYNFQYSAPHYVFPLPDSIKSSEVKKPGPEKVEKPVEYTEKPKEEKKEEFVNFVKYAHPVYPQFYRFPNYPVYSPVFPFPAAPYPAKPGLEELQRATPRLGPVRFPPRGGWKWVKQGQVLGYLDHSEDSEATRRDVQRGKGARARQGVAAAARVAVGRCVVAAGGGKEGTRPRSLHPPGMRQP
ncbi:unnamed protein product [Notodromas monacha]|uniref:Kappa-casein n=1 Tax=Notodromas monacha TaxID=399045 RepID=A0A7R9C070_9CRUS|nr:unnamed protein product [Notodromas monacha]CAG0924891.1 unnamed protein product [Notodromas monacha]